MAPSVPRKDSSHPLARIASLQAEILKDSRWVGDEFTETARARAPSWRNEVTLRSVEMFTEYEPASYAGFVSPTPLMIVVALGDVLTVADLALAAYERALGPKRLVTLKGGHFDAYVADFVGASQPAVEWFTEHLA